MTTNLAASAAPDASHGIDGTGEADEAVSRGVVGRPSAIEHVTVREVLMGAQDNLTNVLAVMLGVSIGSGRADLVALAGVSAAIAEAVSMGGVLYSSTRAEAALDGRGTTADAGRATAEGLPPVASGIVTFSAALLGGLVPLLPFLLVPLSAAVPISIAVSLAALFCLGLAIGRISGSRPWREGLRLIVVAGLAAVSAAIVGSILAVA